MRNLFVLFGFIISTSAFAQLEKIITLPLDVEVSSVDRLGNFYFVLSSGKLQKYDPDGKLMDETSQKFQSLTLLEPWNPLKVFTYSNRSKHYHYLDHHLNLLEDNTLEPSLSITPQLVCPSNIINKAWILDAADFTLKKVDLITNEVELDTPLPPDWSEENSDFVFMREYQNRIFLLDKNKGILMLNKLGILITSIEIKGLSFFNFLGEELCYQNEKAISLMDLITGETRTVATLPDTHEIKNVIITDERLVVVNAENIEIFRLNSSPK